MKEKGKSWRKGVKVGVIAIVLLLIAGGIAIGIQTTEKEKEKIKVDRVREIVKDIEEKHCKMTDEELLNQQLTEEDVTKVREFCSLPTDEKVKILEKEFSKIKEHQCSKDKEGKIVGYNNTYTCVYDGINTGIPNYADLGLSSSTCSWHDPNPDCKIEGKVACLWGCTNVDPVLGWHTKWFSSTSALENEIFPKGYYKVSSNYGGDYRRWVGYGYSYQVHSIGGGYWHSEGPEPSPDFNWYAYLRGWWPVEVSTWHYNC